MMGFFFLLCVNQLDLMRQALFASISLPPSTEAHGVPRVFSHAITLVMCLLVIGRQQVRIRFSNKGIGIKPSTYTYNYWREENENSYCQVSCAVPMTVNEVAHSSVMHFRHQTEAMFVWMPRFTEKISDPSVSHLIGVVDGSISPELEYWLGVCHH